MDWLTFISAESKTLAWPIVAVIAVLVLRREARRVLVELGHRLRSAKAGGVQLEFTEGIEKAEEREVVSTLPINKPDIIADATSYAAPTVDSDISKLANKMVGLPAPFIISQAWLHLEEELRLLFQTLPGVPVAGNVPIQEGLRRSVRANFLTMTDIDQINDLRSLRNVATHDRESSLSESDALRYTSITNQLIGRLRQHRTDYLSKQQPRTEN